MRALAGVPPCADTPLDPAISAVARRSRSSIDRGFMHQMCRVDFVGARREHYRADASRPIAGSGQTMFFLDPNVAALEMSLAACGECWSDLDRTRGSLRPYQRNASGNEHEAGEA